MAIQKIETQKAMKIGVDNVVACKIVDTDTEYKTISEVIALPGAMALNVNANFSMETAFYDNGPGEVASTLGVIETTFNKSALGPKEKAWLLGLNEVKGTDEIVYSQNNVAPWIALGFRSLRSDGTYTYTWLLKGKFTLPEDNNETKADSINFQSDELTGRFVTTNYSFNVKPGDAGASVEKKKLWKLEMNEAFISELSDDDKKSSAKLQIQGWDYLLETIDKSTEGKVYKQPTKVEVKKADGTEISGDSLSIPNVDRTKIFQVKGFATPASAKSNDETCIQAFEYWECKGANDYTPETNQQTRTKSFNDYGNGRFKFTEQTTSQAVTGYIACKAIYGTEEAKKIITVNSPGDSSTKTVDYGVKK